MSGSSTSQIQSIIYLINLFLYSAPVPNQQLEGDATRDRNSSIMVHGNGVAMVDGKAEATLAKWSFLLWAIRWNRRVEEAQLYRRFVVGN
jgi:hypothetical protein